MFCSTPSILCFVTPSWAIIIFYAAYDSVAPFTNWWGSKKSPPWTTIFRQNHILLAITTKSSNSSLEHLRLSASTTCPKSEKLQELFWNFLPQTPHTSMADEQPHKMCSTFSLSIPQIGYKDSFTIPNPSNKCC